MPSQTWVPPGHFYSPLADPSDPCVRKALDLEANPDVPLSALGIDEKEILSWFEKIVPLYGKEYRLYRYQNPNFPLFDALALWAFMLERRPRRYVEAGSGHSSLAAIDAAEELLGGDVDLTFIDPFPETLLSLLPPDSRHRQAVRSERLQDVPLDVFREVDMLFLDTSHVAKTGSDVLDYLFRILPHLRSGAAIHIHDIFYPFEYPRNWIEDQNRSWNEAYFLRAFLQDNPRYRVLFFSDWIFKCKRELLARSMPLCVEHRGGSLWLEKL